MWRSLEGIEEISNPEIEPKKSPDRIKSIRGCRFSSSVNAGLTPILEGRNATLSFHGQVFWLTDHPTNRAFPSRSLGKVASCGVRPRLQRRVHDGFSPSSLLSPSRLRADTHRQVRLPMNAINLNQIDPCVKGKPDVYLISGNHLYIKLSPRQNSGIPY